jgi:hypothetical protein
MELLLAPLLIIGTLVGAIIYSIYKRNFPAAVWITLVLLGICYSLYHVFTHLSPSL